MVASALQVVLAQRLVRTNCETCSEPHELTANERQWLKLELHDDVDRHRYLRGRGCTRCNGTGFRGRTGVYELLEITKPVAEAANDPNPSVFLRAAHAQMAGATLRRHAVDLVVSGKIPVSEATRIATQVED
jgi:MSHA biogenesis protein MshE